MKRISFLIAFASLMLLAFGQVQGASSVTLDNMTGLLSPTGDTVYADSSVKWTFRLINTYGSKIDASSNGYKVFTHRGLQPIPAGTTYTDNFSAITYDSFPWGWFMIYLGTGGLVMSTFSIDGLSADTIGFGGTRGFGTGILDGTDSLCWWVATTPSAHGDTLCIDSAFYPPGGEWLWYYSDSVSSVYPDWGGPYCFYVYDPSVGGVKEVEGPELPNTYSLSQNYPNPFNPSTKIMFDIPTRSHVTLTVYNVLGQKVTTLVDKEMPPGSYVADWNSTSDNGTEVTSGVYFYKLEADDFIQTKKMLLLK
jgi:hypothetical protein